MWNNWTWPFVFVSFFSSFCHQRYLSPEVVRQCLHSEQHSHKNGKLSAALNFLTNPFKTIICSAFHILFETVVLLYKNGCEHKFSQCISFAYDYVHAAAVIMSFFVWSSKWKSDFANWIHLCGNTYLIWTTIIITRRIHNNFIITTNARNGKSHNWGTFGREWGIYEEWGRKFLSWRKIPESHVCIKIFLPFSPILFMTKWTPTKSRHKIHSYDQPAKKKLGCFSALHIWIVVLCRCVIWRCDSIPF